ncbi:aminotransferase class I/II-fold pyridoxal phosphate-dependent enzyme, partial [Nanoarchaeota archaeon]
MNPQAEELNKIFKRNNEVVYGLLSEKGKNIFFPKKGILAQTAEAKGKEINATIGIAKEEDGSPMRLRSIASKIDLDPQDAFPYAPSYGKPELRERWLKHIREYNPSTKSQISTPIVTNALTHGLSIVGYMFLNEGDKIIIPDKFWGNYRLIFENGYGAVIDTYNTFSKGGLDLDSLREKLKGSGKKVLLFNFPNNPTGYTPTNDEVDKIVSIVKESAQSGIHILVICDDAYFGLVYEEGITTESLFGKLANIHENVLTVKVDGATKEHYVWGFRIGFVTYGIKEGSEELYKVLEDKTAGAVRGNISNSPHLSQSLVLEMLDSPDYVKETSEKKEILRRRYEIVKKVLSDFKFEKFFKPLPFNSGYFMCVELLNGLEGEKIRKKLLDEYNTGVIAIGNLIRIAFASVPIEKIPTLFENLYDACK